MARRLLLSAVVVAVALLASPRGAVGQYPFRLCGDGGIPADSVYKASLSRLAATMPKNASTSPGLFTTAQAGVAPEQVWALALCRGDATPAFCSSCLAQGFQDLTSCNYKDASIYYDFCYLTYTNVHFRAADDIKYSLYYPIRNLGNATAEPARFQRVVAALMNATASSAAFNSSTRLYASGQADFDKELPEVYSWAQCTPDMSPDRCWTCLVRIMKELPTFFTDAIGARVLGIRCSIRYETQPFFNGSATVRLSSATSAPGPAPNVVPNVVTSLPAVGQGRRYRVPIMVPIILLPVLAAISFVACFFLWRRRGLVTEEKQPYPSYSAESQDIESVDSMMIDISTLRAATGDFADSNKLGEGGFGAVYKGTLPDGEEIAVKRMSKSSTQGVDELKNELALVAKLSHKNLVRLIGVCLEQQERLLVYEFVPNRSLDLILFAQEAAKREQLDWAKRYKIIDGIARGLQYLHEDSQLKVVHRDLKASNVLLDADMSPKISDFGLAKIFGRDQTQGITNRVVGTHGYMAPEYMMRGNYSVKSDAFSFGVMVLEIVTGRKNTDDRSRQSEDPLTKVWEHWMSGTVLEVVDPCMNGSFLEKEVLKCVHIGLLCVQGNPVDRPTMSAVVTMLGSETFTLHALSKPRRNGAGAD